MQKQTSDQESETHKKKKYVPKSILIFTVFKEKIKNLFLFPYLKYSP